ncbi:hypothetical protein PHYPSEUDO_005856 [Phytophthora pseudosyringae]|uniref:Uncharacterized protein n=1 Tax=Phytophthora pseudosyringae TaxID=221518 RepID=A0A8T1WHH6_9STRA|nr:hypothetical protein PHYPSEUDO_005856 [Phytophthora pseudosyringae]
MSSVNVTVKTVAELEDAVHSIFEKALNQVHFCDAYAEVCEELEAKCSTLQLTKSIMWGGLIYLSLDDTLPRMVAGPFITKESARQDHHVEREEVPENLIYVCRLYHDGKLLKLWKDEVENFYYVSTHIVILGPYVSQFEAKHARNVYPVRTVLLRCCQRELEVNTNQRMKKADAERVKLRKLGACHFLGALFRRGFVEASALHRCMEVLLDVRQNIAGDLDLLSPRAAPDAINLTAVCTLLESKSVGERLESRSKDPLVSKYYWVLKSKLNGRVLLPFTLATRVQAVIDLRANKWDANGMEEEKACKEIAQLIGNKQAQCR